MPGFIVVSYYTKDYEICAHRLMDSLRLFNLDFQIDELPEFENWQKATHYKATFIRKMLDAFHPNAVVWIDADAVVRKEPALFAELAKTDCDVAFYSRMCGELLSGTLYFGNTDGARNLIDTWIEENIRSPHLWEQQNLKLAIDSKRYDTLPPMLGILPAEMCCIFDTGRKEHPGIDPVVEHFQKSREMRRKAVAR